MTTIIGKKILGRPQFYGIKNVNKPTPSGFINHPTIVQLRPSSFDQHSIWERIQRLFLRIASLFINIKTPSKVSFHSLVTGIGAKKNEMLQLYKKCLAGADETNTSPLQQYEILLSDIKRIDRLTSDQCIKERKIQNLPAGEKLLLPLTSRDDVQIFYLLEKKQQATR